MSVCKPYWLTRKKRYRLLFSFINCDIIGVQIRSVRCITYRVKPTLQAWQMPRVTFKNYGTSGTKRFEFQHQPALARHPFTHQTGCVTVPGRIDRHRKICCVKVRFRAAGFIGYGPHPCLVGKEREHFNTGKGIAFGMHGNCCIRRNDLKPGGRNAQYQHRFIDQFVIG